MSIREAFENQQLKDEVRTLTIRCSQYVNLLEQIRVALEEDDDPEAALALVKGES